MKLTHEAVSHVNTVLKRIESSISAFTHYPELLNPLFWEYLMLCAENPQRAKLVLTELDKLGEDGACFSPMVARNMAQTMRTARETLRDEALRRSAEERVLTVLKREQHKL